MITSPRSLRSAVANVTAKALRGQVADLRRTPADPIGKAAGHPLLGYRSPEWLVPAGPPVLFVPSPGAPARCFDLRRGGSLAEHVVGTGRLAYLLDHRPAAAAGPADLLADWALSVLPAAVREVSRDAGGQPVQLVGWGLGGVLALLAATDTALPISSIAAIAPTTAPRRARSADRLAGLERTVRRSYNTVTRIDDRDYLAQREAVDRFLEALEAHPGRDLTDACAALLAEADLAGEGITLGGRRLDLAEVKVPVLAVAGSGDRMAPPRAVHDLTRALRSAPQVRFEIAHGDHLGVLTGRAARRTTWSHLDRWLDEGILRHGIRPHRRQAAAGAGR
ncbi:serine aminopeptidase domain-containing protein [Thermomonospora cellulosilytica]|uniref:Polyhydroxyalkanoate synthase n=1 Tax=Thermomonospora cellulosilytica TaxID=1411118 RepID=A0A7W3MZ11_9ACTN|nr:alpha/beta hydrolase [Thermomonospora cellulosilytica]MBA9004491.1 polyhydroxyalkanoate synthase [Thermomonospora cellulosilytica]